MRTDQPAGAMRRPMRVAIMATAFLAPFGVTYLVFTSLGQAPGPLAADATNAAQEPAAPAPTALAPRIGADPLDRGVLGLGSRASVQSVAALFAAPAPDAAAPAPATASVPDIASPTATELPPPAPEPMTTPASAQPVVAEAPPARIQLAQAASAPVPQAAAQPPAAPPQPIAGDLRFAGSSTLGERLVPDLADAYLAGAGYRLRGWGPGRRDLERVQEARNANGTMRVFVEFQGTGSATTALLERRADFGMLSRAPTSDEVARLQRGVNLDVLGGNLHVLALGGIGIVVHPDNPVQRLTTDQIQAIFGGAITNWSQVGGPNRAIQVYVYGEPGSGTTDTFNALVMRGRRIAATAEPIMAQPDIASTVAGEPGGIGYLGLSFIGAARPLNIQASCGLEFEANDFAVKTEDYPISRRLYVIQANRGQFPLADAWLRWAGSNASSEAVTDAGYTSLMPQVGSRAYTVFRLADAARAAPAAPDSRYLEAMSAYTIAVRNSFRLSTTFRYDLGNTNLDVRGIADLDRVAEFLTQPDNRRYRVQVLGFADNSGAFGQNRVLSDRRAQDVAQRLRERGVQVALARGYAHVAPVACDEDPDAPIRNRRVEIWLAPG